MTRALAAGVGSSTTLLAAAASVLLLAGAIVAFQGDGASGVLDRVTPLIVDDGSPASGGSASERSGFGNANARDRGVSADEPGSGRTLRSVAGRPRTEPPRRAFFSDPTRPSAGAKRTAPSTPTRGSSGSTQRPSSSGSPSPSRGSGGGGGDSSTTPDPVKVIPPAPSVSDTVTGVTKVLGGTVTGVTQEAGKTVGQVSPPLGETVAGLGTGITDTTTEAGTLVGGR